ncbi:hypothetical protein [Pseudomonas xantholysinigenes]|jgi:hypothetical protein|nr:hypothetical protein [Pseudomonas xantholysinigenes]
MAGHLARFTFDTGLPGNANVGHDYGASGFDDGQGYDLIEDMKRL